MLYDMVYRRHILLHPVRHMLVGFFYYQDSVTEVLQILVNLLYEFFVIGRVYNLRHGIVHQPLLVQQRGYGLCHGGLARTRIACYDKTEFHAEVQVVGVVVCLHGGSL